MSARTLRVETPHMQGDDVAAWQRVLNAQMATWGVDYRVAVDSDFGVVSRDLTATVLYGLGYAQGLMKDGVTPDLRIKVRNKRQSPAEKVRYAARAGWRRRIKAKHASKSVASPLSKILSSSWGYHPPVHDGVDLICPPNALIYAICDARVIDVRGGGWWGKAPSGDVSKGDGIIQLECTTDVGPFRKGMHFGYGHAEHAKVKIGQNVKAGDTIGHAGLAVAWHVHFMANGGNTAKGVGSMDPMPFVNYAIKNG